MSADQQIDTTQYTEDDLPQVLRTPLDAPQILVKHELVPFTPFTIEEREFTGKARQILYFKSKGLSNVEIASHMGIDILKVQVITKQKWFQRALMGAASKVGESAVRLVLEGEALDSIATLVALRDDPAVKADTRRQCAVELLNHSIGRPIQRVEAQLEKPKSYTDVEDLRKQLDELVEEETRLKKIASLT